MTGPVVIAIDPGRAKCGIAVVAQDGAVRERAVIETGRLTAHLTELLARFSPESVLLGDGTYSAAARAAVQEATGVIPVQTVDEMHTSEEARRRYVADHPPSGLGRLVPRGLRTPDQPYDDYVAVILAERWWKERVAHS